MMGKNHKTNTTKNPILYITFSYIHTYIKLYVYIYTQYMYVYSLNEFFPIELKIISPRVKAI